MWLPMKILQKAYVITQVGSLLSERMGVDRAGIFLGNTLLRFLAKS